MVEQSPSSSVPPRPSGAAAPPLSAGEQAAPQAAPGSLDSLLRQPDLKFIFVGGKGGVGKTTSAAGLAARLSYSKKVLLVSTDPAHSLSDAFRTPFSNEPLTLKPLFPNLDVMEIDPSETLKTELGDWNQLSTHFVSTSSESAASSAGGPPAAADDDMASKIQAFQDWLSGIPGIDEATALASAITHIESGRYDLIVFDTAPTGHTLKLLQLPDILQAGIEKLESWQSKIWGYWDAISGALKGRSDDQGR